jgi:hypothetical protein
LISRSTKILGVTAAAAFLATVLLVTANALAPDAGLRRYTFAQAGFGGVPIDDRASDISLDFVTERTDLPRQFFSVRWRGFVFIPKDQTVEFFAGGNDEVELRIDGELVVRRDVTVGLRTIGRKLTLSRGSHAIAVDYQQFGGGMALNIQRDLDEGRPGPFERSELFVDQVNAGQVFVARASEWLRPVVTLAWLVFAATVVAAASPTLLQRWRAKSTPRNSREYVARVRGIAPVALLVPTVVFLIGPHTIFANNAAEFAVPFSEIVAPWIVRSVVVNWAALFVMGCGVAMIANRLAQMYVALLLATGFLLWGQGNLWNADYGVLAGQNPNLAQHAGRQPYELAVWGTALALAVIFSRSISRIAAFASLAFVGVQGAAVAFSLTHTTAAASAPWIEPPADIYRFSSTRNVIHIVLDEFQSDVFNEIFEQDRARLDRELGGFQYFRDHAGSFPTTAFSMPAMLAGREYRNEKPAPDFVREAFKQSSVLSRLAQAGYDIDAASIVPIDSFEQWMGTDAEPNWEGARFHIRKPYVSREDYREVSARQLLELSLFRHVPHAAKTYSVAHSEPFYRPTWMDRIESPAHARRHEASNSAAFLEQFIGLMNVGRARPVYKLLHVGLPHRPVVVDRECRFIGVTEMSRQSYSEQSRCALKLVAALLDRTRALGLYDSSLIIISSDHGTDLEPAAFRGTSESLALVPGPTTVRLPAIASTAKAVMLIKLPNRTGPIIVSDAPTSHVDLPSTILDALGVAGGKQDAQMFDRDPRQPRTRVFGMYNPFIRFPKEYLDRLDVLTLDGPVLDAAAWNVQRLIWQPNARLDDTDVDFGPRSGNYYLGPGWSLEKRETIDGSPITFVQALTPRAIISASLPTRAVEMVLRASSPANVGPRAVRVDIDGHTVAHVALPGRDGYRDIAIPVPNDPSRPPISEITLHFDARGTTGFIFKADRMAIR